MFTAFSVCVRDLLLEFPIVMIRRLPGVRVQGCMH
jgi:hypothetical protein